MYIGSYVLGFTRVNLSSIRSTLVNTSGSWIDFHFLWRRYSVTPFYSKLMLQGLVECQGLQNFKVSQRVATIKTFMRARGDERPAEVYRIGMSDLYQPWSTIILQHKVESGIDWRSGTGEGKGMGCFWARNSQEICANLSAIWLPIK